ncbi:acyl carrier protein [Nonomuraea sp. NPDC050547]|uniref:acyl carrier protein n=1 Tax=Nonomuraea sp. NPDC050547 TaxID=3364368 RepID=UPI0037B33FAF
MEDQDLAERVVSVYTQVMGGASVNGLDTLPEDAQGWDSLAQVRLFTAIERDFARELPRHLMLIGPSLAAFVTELKRP